MDAGQLTRIMPTLSAVNAETWLPILLDTFGRFDISTPGRQAAFLAQAAHESGEFSRLVENLNYSAAGLRATWPRRFPVRDDDPTDSFLHRYARHPEAIANYVYANRGGNGSEASGDGWKYRGRGLFQRTFLAAYRHDGSVLGRPLTTDPDQVATPPVAALTAGLYWQDNRLSPLADRGDLQAITQAINGGLIGQSDRLMYYTRACAALGAAA